MLTSCRPACAATAVSSRMGAPNCTRSPAYFSAARYAASAMPCACAAMARRAPFMRLITYVVSPRRRSPTSSAGASVELQLAGGRAVDAELVLEPADLHVLVALVDEQRQPAGVGGALLAARQHQGDRAAAVGDEALDAVQVPAAVRRSRRLELDVLQVGAGLGLGEGHRAGHLAAGEAGQVAPA